MRFVQSLLMLLMLVTFSTGFGNTTADLKQNSKTVFAKPEMVQALAIEAVSVVDFQAVLYDETQLFRSSDVTHFNFKNVLIANQKAVIRDVGWTNQTRTKQLPFDDPLLNWNDSYRHKKSKQPTNRIRETNPYGTEIMFSFSIQQS